MASDKVPHLKLVFPRIFMIEIPKIPESNIPLKVTLKNCDANIYILRFIQAGVGD